MCVCPGEVNKVASVPRLDSSSRPVPLVTNCTVVCTGGKQTDVSSSSRPGAEWGGAIAQWCDQEEHGKEEKEKKKTSVCIWWVLVKLYSDCCVFAGETSCSNEGLWMLCALLFR